MGARPAGEQMMRTMRPSDAASTPLSWPRGSSEQVSRPDQSAYQLEAAGTEPIHLEGKASLRRKPVQDAASRTGLGGVCWIAPIERGNIWRESEP